MSVTGPGGAADDLLSRLNAIEGSGSSVFGVFDSSGDVRDAIEALSGQSTIGAADVEALVTVAEDYGEITDEERQLLVGLLGARPGDFEPAALSALARFLGVEVPQVRADRSSSSTGVTDILARATITADPTLREAFRTDDALVAVLLGQASLQRGAGGDAVRTVQKALIELGYDLGRAGADGDFGGGTAAAVEAFQRGAGLQHTGAVDAATLRAINDQLQAPGRASFAADGVLAQVLSGDKVLALGMGGEPVEEVQLALLDAGYDLGAAGADGDFGSGTRAAIYAVQRRLGLPVTGSVDAATLRGIGRLAGTDHRADRSQPLIAAEVGLGKRNAIADVKAVQEQLKELGFYSGAVNGRYTNTLGRSIQLFDGVTKNANQLSRWGGGRLSERTLTPGEDAERWLRAQNAPRWQRIPQSGAGWVNADRDGHSHASSWLIDALNRIGARYQAERAGHPTWEAIHTNDASMVRGGDTPDHSTHEAGLDLDVNLGRGGLTFRMSGYNQEETWAKIKAFLDDPGVDKIFFNDPVLIRRANADPSYRGRLLWLADHHHHLHVDFKVPERQ